MNKDDEMIMVVPRSALDAVGHFEGLEFDVQRYWHLLERPEFRRRGDMEKDPSFKQIIPYQIVVRDDKALLYQRTPKSGEGRLQGRYALGFGGHLNEDDMTLAKENEGDKTWSEAYVAGVTRELDEEIRIASPTIQYRVAALLNDEADEVGRVHLGIVHVIEINPMGGVTYGTEGSDHSIALKGFHNPRELRQDRVYDNMEGWARICAQNLDTLFHSNLAHPFSL